MRVTPVSCGMGLLSPVSTEVALRATTAARTIRQANFRFRSTPPRFQELPGGGEGTAAHLTVTVQNENEPQPSVVTFTTLMAGLAVTELLNRMLGLADAAPTEILLRLHDRKTSLNRRAPRPGCICSMPSAWGLGLQEPYLDLTWPEQPPG
jgi:hypothetical protein